MGCKPSSDIQLRTEEDHSHLVYKIDLNESNGYKEPCVYLRERIDLKRWELFHPTEYADPPALGDYDTTVNWGGRLPVRNVTLTFPIAKEDVNSATSSKITCDVPLISMSRLLKWMNVLQDMRKIEEEYMKREFKADAYKDKKKISISQAMNLLLHRAVTLQIAYEEKNRGKKKNARISGLPDENESLDISGRKLKRGTTTTTITTTEPQPANAIVAPEETSVYYGAGSVRKLLRKVVEVCSQKFGACPDVYIVCVVQRDFSFYRDYLLEVLLTLGTSQYYPVFRRLLYVDEREDLSGKSFFRFQSWLSDRLTMPVYYLKRQSLLMYYYGRFKKRRAKTLKRIKQLKYA